MSGEREGLAAVIAGVLAEHDGWSQTGPHDNEGRFDLVCYGCGDLLFPGIPDGFGEARMDELARAHQADALADLLAARERRVRGEALRVASLDLDVPRRGTIDGVRVVRLIDVTAWLRDEATRQEADR